MKKSKRLLIFLYISLGLFGVVGILSIIFYALRIFGDSPVFLIVDVITLLVFGGLSMYIFALYMNERRVVKEIINENDYNLHRKSTFYNYNTFARSLNVDSSNFKNTRGYFVVFNVVKVANVTTYSISKTADFNGFISDYINETYGVENPKRPIKEIHYCFYRGNFLFYMECDESKLNTFINELENEAYRIAAEKDFRIYMQPTFGIYEHEAGKSDSLFDMTSKATAAREMAERNYENALFFAEEMLSSKTSDDADEIAQALEKNEFVVYYQPKFNLAAKKFTSAEALIRWDSPTRGLLSPMRFIDTAENSGLIHKIDMYVFEQVCKDLDETRRKGRRLVPVSINFSLYEFYSPNFVEDLIKTIEKYNINPSLIEIEVLEGTTGVNLFLSISILKKIKEYGIRILMDDFGVGYSNFNNLKNLPIDVIKIDKSFIDNIAEDVKSREIAKFMIEFSKEIGLEVVAEGVDNQKQVDILKKFKCDTIQGFYYSKALPRQEFEKFIATNTFEKRDGR